jgi:probable F420-dependent oxidoreductase
MKASEVGKLGVWGFLDACDYKQCIELAQTVEQLGYSTLWVPEAFGRDPFVTITLLAGETEKLYLATGIANIYARDPMAMASARNAIDELSGGRLILGLGVSHRELVSAIRSHDYGKPVSTMRAYLDAMNAAMYTAPPPPKQGMIVLAALREKMLGLAGSASDGAHPYFVTPEHTARAREIIGPSKFLAPEQKVLLVKNPGEARSIARKFMEMYLGLENYRNNLLTLGFTADDFEHGGSDRLVDAIVAWGNEATILKRLEAHWQNGADHVCIQALRPDGEPGYDPRVLQALAPKP